mgnify:FL=1
MKQKENSEGFLLREHKRQAFDKRLIKEIVALVEQGLPRRAALEKYGMTKSTLGLWMRNFGSREYQNSKRTRYPVTLRRSVVRAVEGGMTISQAQVAFNIKSHTAIGRWIKKEREEKANLVIDNPIPMSKKPKKENKESVKALQQALAEAQLKIKALDTMIDIAEEQLKINIRKKSGAKQSEE